MHQQTPGEAFAPSSPCLLETSCLKLWLSLESQVDHQWSCYRYEKLDKEIADLRNEITDKESRAVEIRAFMKALKSSKQLPTEFNADIWNTIGDKMTISENGTIIVTLKDGTEIKD